MSTHRHIDRICVAAVVVALIIAILFMNGEAVGIVKSETNLGYEDRLFDTSSVHTVDIVMDDWDSFIEGCESEEYSACSVVIDGESFKNVGIRAKGNTSLSNVSQLGSERYSFKLEFDQYESSLSYHGLDKLCLNNLIQDNTMMKDYLVYQMMADFGVDTPLCSFVYITVNGEDWGLYLAVEGVEDSFLQRNYGSDTGELYKPDSMSFGGGRGNGKDFSMDDFDFGNNEDDSTADTNTQQTEAAENSAQGEMQIPSDMQGGGMQMPSDMQNGEAPTMPEGMEDMDFSEIFEDMENGEMPTAPEGMEDMEMPSDGQDFAGGDMTGGGGGMQDIGMGSDDVKLKYTDDSYDSYSNIFDSAKTDITDSDKDRLIASLKSLSEYSDLESCVDIEAVLRYFVVHNFVVNGDSYTGSMVHNYYLRESDGLLSMIPWDYNLAFGTFQGGSADSAVNADIDGLVSGGDADDRPLFGWILSDESYTEQYHELYAEFIERWFTNGELEALIEETAELISPYVEKDPTKFCTTDEFNAGVEALTEFVSLRSEAVSAQLSGSSEAVDCADLNLSDMGTMGNTAGGGQQGGDMQMPDTTQSTDMQMPDDTQSTDMQMPDTTQGGEMPTMPSGDTTQSGEMPTMPGGDTTQSGETPTMPSGDATQGGEMPTMPGGDTTQSGEMPTMPSGDTTQGGETPTMPGGDTTQSGETPTMPSGDTTQSGETPTMPEGGEQGDMPTTEETSSDKGEALILLGVSAAVLAAGLIVAIKYKRR